MTGRRIWPVNKWVGGGYPKDARFIQTPAILMARTKALAATDRLTLVLLVERARQQRADHFRVSVRTLSEEFGIRRHTLGAALDRLAAHDLIGYRKAEGRGNALIDMEPVRHCARMWSADRACGTKADHIGELSTGSSTADVVGRKRPTDGTKPTHKLDESVPQVGRNRPTTGSPEEGREKREEGAHAALAGKGQPRALSDEDRTLLAEQHRHQARAGGVDA